MSVNSMLLSVKLKLAMTQRVMESIRSSAFSNLNYGLKLMAIIVVLCCTVLGLSKSNVFTNKHFYYRSNAEAYYNEHLKQLC